MTNCKFVPVAIVGRGCVLPGAANPDQLRDLIKNKRVCIGSPEPGSWRVEEDKILSVAGPFVADHIWNTAGGYVKDFDPRPSEPGQISRLDSVFRWTFGAAAQALDTGAVKQPRKAGLIMGNLSYPTVGFNQYAESIYIRQLLGQQGSAQPAGPIEARNRFSSGLPAMLIARELGFQGGSLALDAACASGLYAVKLACDRLQSGTADAMLAGAVNAADPLFIHMGFCALSAMSRSGQSRPFNREADGLVPSEGAAFVLLKRFSDAMDDGDNILGVIRGVGLSNDGRSGGFLSPSADGQVQSLLQAYASIDGRLGPEDVSLVECHATGTPVGDATEIDTLKQVYGENDLVLSSLKANLGHLITTSGVAGVLKVLSAFEDEELPATPNAHPLLDGISNSPFSVLAEPKSWQGRNGRLIAGVSSFGFGGNNAHLVLEKWSGDVQQGYAKGAHTEVVQTANQSATSQPDAIAVIAMAVNTHKSSNLEEYLEVVASTADHGTDERKPEVSFYTSDMKFPPNDLKQSLGQQLMVLEVAGKVLAQLEENPLDPSVTGVYVGMGTDPETCRYSLRWRLAEMVRAALETGNLEGADEAWVDRAKAALIEPLSAAAVIGKMPNIPANRLSNQYDLRGPGFTVSREELSGDAALDLAINAISRGEIETALVGAVDLSRETVHRQALQEVVGEQTEAADAAVMLAVKGLASAERDGDGIIALVERSGSDHDSPYTLRYPQYNNPVKKRVGHAHAASGLLNLVAGIQFLQRGIAIPGDDDLGSVRPLLTQDGKREMRVENRSFCGERSAFLVRQWRPEADSPATGLAPAVEIELFAALDHDALVEAVKHDRQMDGADVPKGWQRLAIVGESNDIETARLKALRNLQEDRLHDGWNLGGVFYRHRAVAFSDGADHPTLAFAFTGAASAYPGMGRELLLARPELTSRIVSRMKNSHAAAGWAYNAEDSRASLPFYQLAGSSFLCQIHAEFSMHVLGLEPDACLGLSSGETNALFALGAWQDIDDLFDKIASSGLYTDALACRFDSVKQHWGLADTDEVSWDNWRILGPVSLLQELMASLDKDRVTPDRVAPDRVYLTIINSANDCVIGGDSSACRTLLDKLPTLTTTGQQPFKFLPLGHDMAIHCAAVQPFEAVWRDLHNRPTVAPAGIRFYSNYLDGVFDVTREAAADALTGQALQTIDFPKIVNLAWQDGVRIFVEHGPRNSLSNSIKEILGDKTHVAVALDQQGVDSNIQVHRAAAELWCAGVDVNLHNLRQPGTAPLRKAEDRHDNAGKISFALRPPQVSAIPLPVLHTAAPDTEAPATEVAAAEAPTSEAAAALYSPSRRHVGPAHGRLMQAAPVLARASLQQYPAAVVERVAAVEQPPLPRDASEPIQGNDHAPPSSSDLISGLLVSTHRNLKEAHEDYLAKQSATHAAYSASMLRVQEALFGGLDGKPVSVTGSGAATRVLARQGTINAPPHGEPTQQGQMADDGALQHADQQVSRPPVDLGRPGPARPGHARPGPKFNREELEVLAGGKISTVFGPLFEQQDQYEVQVRMPEPPLLLCDRVLGIEGEAGSMGTGTIWTETDVLEDSWYLHNRRMPGGIFIEAGQADLLLISWLGIDFENRGERAYRLLGCELVFHGDLPESGDTLQYEIKVDGHARQGDVRLFFFHYDCLINGRKRISVRNGQAGFFSADELENSDGVLWSAHEAVYTSAVEMPAPPARCSKRSFSHDDVVAYTEGDLVTCFGVEFEWAGTHTRSPRTPMGDFNFIGAIAELDQQGGPAGRGYLKAISPISEDDWYFTGHFKNDPCMPGTLMAEACLQVMGFYLTATGRTLRRDGWRFQPVRDTNYKFVCRGQVLPTSREMVYELFVDEIIEADMPMIFAHVLCTVDGRKAFLCERLGLQLVPDWPAKEMPQWWDLMSREDDSRPLAAIDGFPLDAMSLLNCAWGQPSSAFGPGFSWRDGVGRSPRLPGPPYHFMTRISALSGEMGAMQTGAIVEALHDIPNDAWYFEENGYPTMPSCVLMEIALQPCGWLASYTLAQEAAKVDLLFRNLDGTSTQTREITPADGSITTRAELTSLSKVGDLILVQFTVQCRVGEELIADMQTGFGFFPPESMAGQKGLAVKEEEKDITTRHSQFTVDLRDQKGPFFDDPSACLPASKLLMLDVIDGFWPDGGQHGRGAIRGIKYVNPTQWFFKAHFFQDPVQPGSLGIEAMLQLMQAYMLQTNKHHGMQSPHFEPLRMKEEIEWHYRGQVTPDRDKVVLDFEVIEEGTDDKGPFVCGEARLWVDGLKIYHAPRLGMRLVENAAVAAGATVRTTKQSSVVKWSLSTADDAWVLDHCPTYTIPALPMACELDMMARAAAESFPGRKLTGVIQAEAKQWMSFTQDSLSGYTEVEMVSAGEASAEIFMQVAGRKDPVLTARSRLLFSDSFGPSEPHSLQPLKDPVEVENWYSSGILFHGKSFQLVKSFVLGSNGATGVLNARSIRGQAGNQELAGVPAGLLNPALLDAALHLIPHDNYTCWCPEVSSAMAAYPVRMEKFELYEQIPADGQVKVEARFLGLESRLFPCSRVVFMHVDEREHNVIASFELVQILLPKGPLGTADPIDRRGYLRDRQYIPALTLSNLSENAASLDRETVSATDWLEGTVARIYNGENNSSPTDLTIRVCVAEQIARHTRIHPYYSSVDDSTGRCENLPLNRLLLDMGQQADTVTVTSETPDELDWRAVRAFWIAKSGQHKFIHDLCAGLVGNHVRRLVIADPQAFDRMQGQPVIYLANHQTGVESFLFLGLISATSRTNAAAIAKKEHLDSWIGDIYRLTDTSLSGKSGLGMLFFDRENQAAMLESLEQYARESLSDRASLLVHPDGTRSHHGGDKVGRLSSVMIDLATNNGLPIVPVKLVGGLPRQKLADKLEFPYQLGRQDYILGEPVPCQTLLDLPYAERSQYILTQLNNLGPLGEVDEPLQPNHELASRVAQHQKSGTTEVQAVLRVAIESPTDVCHETELAHRAIIEGHSQCLEVLPQGERTLIERLLGLKDSRRK